MNWLDTETKAILQRGDEPKLTSSKVAEFALVLVFPGVDRQRLVRAVCRINKCNEPQGAELLRRPLPVAINSDLTKEEAAFGQFELICCDAIAAVIRSEVAEQADEKYLEVLLRRISNSSEFKPVTVSIADVPRNEAGRKFVDQFLGIDLEKLRQLGFPRRFTMPGKKARIMKHWASRVGAQLHDDVVRK